MELFFIVKVFNLCILGGFKFEFLYCDMEKGDEDWNEFNDINKFIICFLLCIEYRIVFLYLYNNCFWKVKLGVYYILMVMYIKLEDLDLLVFYFDLLIYFIVFYKIDKWGERKGF